MYSEYNLKLEDAKPKSLAQSSEPLCLLNSDGLSRASRTDQKAVEMLAVQGVEDEHVASGFRACGVHALPQDSYEHVYCNPELKPQTIKN